MVRKSHAALALVLLSATASAQTERTGNADARVMQQMQQLTTERAQLKAENERMKKELEVAKEELKKFQGEQASLKQKADTASAALARATSGNEDSAAKAEKVNAQLQELVAKYRENVEKLREVEGGGALARNELTGKQRELTMCIDRNAQMFEIANETIDRLARRGSFSAFTDNEPFTKLSRTRLDNLIEDYRYRVDELRMEKRSEQKTSR